MEIQKFARKVFLSESRGGWEGELEGEGGSGGGKLTVGTHGRD